MATASIVAPSCVVKYDVDDLSLKQVAPPVQ